MCSFGDIFCLVLCCGILLCLGNTALFYACALFWCVPWCLWFDPETDVPGVCPVLSVSAWFSSGFSGFLLNPMPVGTLYTPEGLCVFSAS